LSADHVQAGKDREEPPLQKRMKRTTKRKMMSLRSERK
jgi:hypothetical protein